MPKEKEKTEAREKTHSSAALAVKRKTPEKESGPSVDGSMSSATQAGATTAADGTRDAEMLASPDKIAGGSGRAAVMKRVQRTPGNTRAGRIAGEPKQTIQPRLAQQEKESVQRQPTGTTGTTETAKAPAYITADLKQKMTATILAESFEGQESDVRWIYYNRVTTAKGEAGLKGSSAYKQKSVWYKVWLYMLGDTTHGDVKLPTKKEFKGFISIKDFCEKNEFMTTVAMPRAVKVKRLIDETFDKPTTNPYPGWTGQGSLEDFNNISIPSSSYWKMVRAYYWLQEKDIVKDIYVKILPAGENTSVVFDGASIEKYYKTNTLPKNVPLYTPPK